MDDKVAFRIHPRDNVATALEQLPVGKIRITGAGILPWVETLEEIPAGHKLALWPIHNGEKIIKYGIVIGKATRDIPCGGWVHLHCIRSLYDERSCHLDPATGAPMDTKYE